MKTKSPTTQQLGNKSSPIKQKKKKQETNSIKNNNNNNEKHFLNGKNDDICLKSNEEESGTNYGALFLLAIIFVCALTYMYLIYLSFPKLEE
jgi:hypothetical protein